MRSRSFCQSIRRLFTKPILPNYMERLLKKRKYIWACIGHLISSEVEYYLWVRKFKEANSNIPTNAFHFTNGKSYYKTYKGLQYQKKENKSIKNGDTNKYIKKNKLFIIILFWPCFNSRQKNPRYLIICSIVLNFFWFILFLILYILLFLLRYWLSGFFSM